MTRATTILNEQGDVTLIWDEADDDKMEAIIEKKMKEGIVFFIIEPRMGGIARPKLTKLDDASEAREHRALTVKDDDFARFIGEAATADVVKTPAKAVKSTRRAKDAKEAAKSETVGVRQMRGG